MAKMTENQLRGLVDKLNKGITDPRTLAKCRQAIGELMAKPKRRSKPKTVTAGD